MTINHIIIQAGGRGSRLEHLTDNKPKALVPVENLPMIFHLFKKFPEQKYVIIADYKSDVLCRYLECFADVDYDLVCASGSGTCGGIGQATELIPDDVPFMLVWSDLILPDFFTLPESPDDYIGLSQTFPCRWSYKDGIFSEERSEEYGVAGLFVFKNKSILNEIPESGELVRWMSEQGMQFSELGLAGTREFGVLQEYEALEKVKCRPFNSMTVNGNIVTKKPIDKQGAELAEREEMWYKQAISKGISNIPKIISYDPLTMEKISGGNIYEYADVSADKKKLILQNIVKALKDLHSHGSVPSDTDSIKDAYYTKTMKRLEKINNLIPLASNKAITVNGRVCRNVYFYKQELEQKLDALDCDTFSFIHGDCTFSNIMLKGDTPVFIDPRGYFGHTQIYGDPNYDWAKLYYSIVGNYDRFNLKDFRLKINDDAVELSIVSNGWEFLENDFFSLSGTDPQTIKLLHAVIWLSLTTYAWQDYDSICGAFYNGLYYLEEVL